MRTMREVQDCLAAAQTEVLHGRLAAAQTILAQALAIQPTSVELRRAQAGVLDKSGRHADAEELFRVLLGEDAGDAASAFALASILKNRGSTAAAAVVMRRCLANHSNSRDPDLAIQAIELLDDCDRKADAAAIAAAAIDANPNEPRLHAYAGMLQMQLGEFERARRHYLFALQYDERAWEWHVPIGVASAQRYESRKHPDLTLLRNGLEREGLSDKARAELHFALGKAHDDFGDYEEAARHFREGNAIAHRLTKWSRKAWRRAVEARLASPAGTQHVTPVPRFTPVFIVGMPRSGTTLLAELLSLHPKVRNRGELPWIAKLAGLPSLAGDPDGASLEDAAATYASHSRQDDAGDACWFIDKQPLNFRYVDLMLTMFPQAKVIHCRRNERDVALSLWMQCFLEEVQGYSYDFGDMALVMHDCEKLMGRWQVRWPDSIRTVRYEELVADSRVVVESLAAWIGFPVLQTAASAASTSVINTASLWQARQPVHSHSVRRWTRYIGCLPELSQFADGHSR